MKSTTFTVRVKTGVKKRLERLAKSTGRSRSFLAAEAIDDVYVRKCPSAEVAFWSTITSFRFIFASLDLTW